MLKIGLLLGVHISIITCSVGDLRLAFLAVCAFGGLVAAWRFGWRFVVGVLAVWSVGGLVGWRFGRLGRLAVWSVGGLVGWEFGRFGRLAVWSVGGLGGLAVWAVGGLRFTVGG